VGDRVERPRRAADLRPYEIGTGRLTIDLTRLRLRQRTYEISARVGAGQLVVIIPEGVPVRIQARSGIGDVQIPWEGSSGFRADEDFESPGYDEATIRMELDLMVGVGSIKVKNGKSTVSEIEQVNVRSS
jgi:lia operon protein LiaF